MWASRSSRPVDTRREGHSHVSLFLSVWSKKDSMRLITSNTTATMVMFFLLVVIDFSSSAKNHSTHHKWRKKLSFNRNAGRFVSARLPYSSESFYSPPQVLAARGYPTESHYVTTQDGYIIGLHRIPAKTKGKRAVFLQHGVFESSGTWLVNPSSRSLPCLLSDLGYDVWMGNARGNRYSRAHVTLTPDQSEFWNFGWDEIGKYDIPAVINYILTETGLSKLIYTGHSLGGAFFFIAMITNPELRDKIEMMVGLAPVASFAETGTPLRVFAPFSRPLEIVLSSILGVRAFIDTVGPLRRFLRITCEQTYRQARICAEILNAFVVKLDFPNLDLSLWPLIDSNFMMGTSTNVVVQFGQHIVAGQVFQAYDYGSRGNLQRYGSTKPPAYNLTQVAVPTYIFYGSDDNIVAPKDVEWLLPQLPDLKFSKRMEGYTHMDFIWGTDVKQRLYDELIALLPPP